MKLAAAGRARRPMIDMVPMINFAFLLLIFFVLAGRVGKHDTATAALPHAASSVTARAAADELRIGTQTLIWNGEKIAETGLLAHARGWHERHAGATLRLSAAGAADAVRVLKILEALRAAGVADVVLATS